MAFSSGFTAVTGATFLASQYNTYVRDNFTAIWVFTTAGDMIYATSSTVAARLAIGSPRQVLRVNTGGTAPAWSNTIFASITRAAVQSIGTGSATLVSFDTELIDTDGFWDAGSPTIFTVPYTGYYLFAGFFSFASNATGIRYFSLQSGGGTVYSEDKRAAVNGDVTSANLQALRYLAATNTVRMYVYQNSGGNLNVTGLLAATFLGT